MQVSNWVKGQGQAGEPPDDVVAPPRRLPGQFDALDTVSQGVEQGLTFEAGETLAGAPVGSVAEAEVTAGVSVDVEGLWLVPEVFVAVGGGIQNHDPGTTGNPGSGDGRVAGHLPAERSQRCLEADDLVE